MDTIICPRCKEKIQLNEAFSHRLQEEYAKNLEEEKKKLIGMYRQRLKEEVDKTEKIIEDQLRAKITKEMELQLKDEKNALAEAMTQNKTLKDELLESHKSMRSLKSAVEKMEVENEKKLAIEQGKIREEEKRKFEEEYKFKILDKEKKIEDVMKMNEELRRKLEQGSQQLQGELLELELERILKQEFPFDEIRPVPKGITGADIMQVVKNNYGKQCGIILWELKRTKTWSNEWIVKLKQDQREIKAHFAVLISEVLPQDVKHFGYKDGVWVGHLHAIQGIAYSLRLHLLELYMMKSSAVGKNEKMEVLYSYLSGTEFKQRVEAIIESFSIIQQDIEKEKRWFSQKWAKQEKNLRKVIDGTLGMHGDLQSIMGNTLIQLDEMKKLDEEVELYE